MVKQLIMGKSVDSAEFRQRFSKAFDGRKDSMSFDGADKFDLSKLRALGKTYVGTGHSLTAGDGGETVPTPLANWFIDVIMWNTTLEQILPHYPMSASTLEVPKRTALTTTYFVDEGASFYTESGADKSSDATSKDTWTSVTLTAKKMGTLSGYTTELEEGSQFSIGQLVMQSMATDMGWSTERSIIQGNDSGGGTFATFPTGDVRRMWDGILTQIPGAVGDTGGVWTPEDASPEHWVDGGGDILSQDELNEIKTKIEEQGYSATHCFMRPTPVGAMRDPTNFEMFQGMKDVGNQAALIRGYVGDFYNTLIVSSNWLPYDSTSTGINGTGGEFCSASTDTVIFMMDVSQGMIGDKRMIEGRRRHKFEQDIEEFRLTRRLDFKVKHNEAFAGISRVKMAVS